MAHAGELLASKKSFYFSYLWWTLFDLYIIAFLRLAFCHLLFFSLLHPYGGFNCPAFSHRPFKCTLTKPFSFSLLAIMAVLFPLLLITAMHHFKTIVPHVKYHIRTPTGMLTPYKCFKALPPGITAHCQPSPNQHDLALDTLILISILPLL